MARITQTRADLELHLSEQLGFLRSSAEAFDRGVAAEAKRMAVAIRVLVHDTPQSASLLGQLKLLDGTWVDTAMPLIEGNRLHQLGVVGTASSPRGTRLIALLDDVPCAIRRIPFSKWWPGEVYRTPSGTTLTRKSLVLGLANQDGGAHVDPSLSEAYGTLARTESIGLRVFDGQESKLMRGAELHAVRQIAHEVLRTQVVDYSCHPAKEDDEMWIISPSARYERADSSDVASMLDRRVKLGRNQACYCGSGRKFKKCHG